MNDDVRETFKKRSRIIQSVREYLIAHDYLEVETPVLQAIYGGASARPFTTHHNALDIDLFLRVSNELYLKRCITGGFPRVFEFAKNFRNEGIDRTHNPEFTLLEFYQAYADYRDMMVHFENIYAAAARAANGTTVIELPGPHHRPGPALAAPHRQGRHPQVRPARRGRACRDDELKAELAKAGAGAGGQVPAGAGHPGPVRGPLRGASHRSRCSSSTCPRRPRPCARSTASDPTLVERFEPYINGWEVGNAYSELNDPLVQRKLLEEQVERGRGGEDETHPLDEDFLRALEYGMPPTGGVGIGIDRMVMLLTDSPTIKDVLLFPLMKPE